MEKIPNILHMIWIGSDLVPDYFLKNLEIWKQLMPDWDFKVWTNTDLTTDNIDESYLNLINKTNIGAQKADLLRYYVINKFGGYYVDADVTPQKSLNDLGVTTQDLVICHDLQIEWAYIAIGFFGATPKHPVFKYIIEQMFKVDFNETNIHLTTGPAAFGNAYYMFKDSIDCLILPYWYFYRNKKGDININGDLVLEDVLNVFGSHRYAATWVS